MRPRPLSLSLFLLSGAVGTSVSAAPLPSCAGASFRGTEASPKAGESYESYRQRVRRAECRKKWTILVYMAADNDLGPYAWWDLYEMEAAFGEATRRAASTDKLDLVVQVDTPGANGVARYHMFQGRKPYQTKRVEDFRRASFEQVESPLVAKLPEANSGDAETLRGFLDWGLEAYPAEHTMVVLWGHGAGWTPKPRRHLEAHDNTKVASGGYGFDDTSRSVMDIPSLARVLKAVTSERLDGRKIDVLSMDACLMQMVEVVVELEPSVRFAIGSTDIQSHLGLPYRRLLWEMNKDTYLGLKRDAPPTADDAYLVAKMIPTLFKTSLNPNRSLQGRIDTTSYASLTSSSVHLEELVRQLLPELRALSAALATWTRAPLRQMELQSLARSMDARPYAGSARDLGAFLVQLRQLLESAEALEQKPDPSGHALRRALDDAQAALAKAVVAAEFGTDYAKRGEDLYLLGFKGLSTWLPLDENELRLRLGDFRTSRFYRETNWGAWIRRLY